MDKITIWECVSGGKSAFFLSEDVCRKWAAIAYDLEIDGVPFVKGHEMESNWDFVALLNEVTARRSGQATGASRQTHVSASGDSNTHGD